MKSTIRRARWRVAGIAVGALVAMAPGAAAQQDPGSPAPLSLGDAARLAARQSALATGARRRADQADARVVQRRADLLPSISGLVQQGSRTFNTATFGLALPGIDPAGEVRGPVNTLDVRARAAQTIVDLGAIARLRSARASAGAFDADAESAAEQAAAIAAVTYLRVLRGEAELGARASDSALAHDLLGIARDQLRAGVGVALDVTRAEAQAAGIRAQLISARSARDRARLELVRALGVPVGTRLDLTDSLGALSAADPAPDEAAAIERALASRPDLRAEDERVHAAQRAVAAVRAERLPSLVAFGDVGAIGISADRLLNTYTWGVQLTVPILDGFRREGRIQEQEALRRELEVRRADLRQQAAIEVRAAILDLTAAREQREAARERLRLAEQELAQARERFRAGVAGNADVINALLALNDSRNLLLDAFTAYQSARVGFARAQGSVTALP